jgi:signal peptidase I
MTVPILPASTPTEDAPGGAEPAAGGSSRPVTGRARPRRRRTRVVDAVAVVLLAVLVAAIVRSVVIQTFSIPTESMEQTLLIGDRVVVDKLTYRFREPRRQEIVVFRTPSGSSAEFRQLVKRIVGVPGDVVSVDAERRVLVNGALLTEPYLEPGTVTEDLERVVVPPGSFFVMGDNRGASFDGRYFGLVPRRDVIGRAALRVWPPSRIGRP